MRLKSGILIALALGVGISQAAFAADMPVKAGRAVLPYSWTGFYVGVRGGGDWGRINGDFTGAGTAYSHNTSGWNLGAHVGYQYQWTQLVLGAEVGASALGSKGSVTCPAVTFTCEERANSLLEVTGKIGWAWDRALLYGKVGWGQERVKSTTTPTFPAYDDTRYLGGLILGAGLEYAFWQNWSAGVEYIHLDMRGQTFAPGTPPGVVRNVSGNDNLLRAVLDYRFGGL